MCGKGVAVTDVGLDVEGHLGLLLRAAFPQA